MSAVVRTLTPFIHLEYLTKALECLKLNYEITKEQIILLDFKDYRGNWKLEKQNGKYVLIHDSHANNIFTRYQSFYNYDWNNLSNHSVISQFNSISDFLAKLEIEYLRIEQETLEELERLRKEEELKRLEEERKAFVEKQKQEVVKRAQEQGYSYQIKNVNNQIKIILTKNTY